MNKTITSFSHLCSECEACLQACPKGAIKICMDTEGFGYPVVSQDVCINCGICLKVCPMLHANEIKHAKSTFVYAVQSKDSATLFKSSSGGVFSILAHFVLEKNGVVYGAAWDKDMVVKHIGVETEKELENLRGSKYIHSNTTDVFIEIKKHLINGRWVLFTGTPCQVAGLRLFLRNDYSELITADIVCHGTPSQNIFDLFINNFKKEHNAIIKHYSFRDKKIMGWSTTSTSYVIDKKSGKEKYIYYDKNLRAYFNAFIRGYISRNDCYCCPFACPERVSDITLADYWDVNKHHPEITNLNKGVSLVLLNTEKGKNVFESLKDRMLVWNSTLQNALDTTNNNLKYPTSRPIERETSYIHAFDDYISFRNYCLSGDKPESFFRKLYYIKKIKNFHIVRWLMK